MPTQISASGNVNLENTALPVTPFGCLPAGDEIARQDPSASLSTQLPLTQSTLGEEGGRGDLSLGETYLSPGRRCEYFGCIDPVE